MRVLVTILLLTAMSATVPVRAQTPDRTGTGGGPDSTITAPHTTSDGTTKPPGIAEGPETPAERRALDRIERQDDRIESSICEGCK